MELAFRLYTGHVLASPPLQCLETRGTRSFKIVTIITVLYQEHLTDINLLHLNNPVIYYDVIQQTKAKRPRKINTFLNYHS